MSDNASNAGRYAPQRPIPERLRESREVRGFTPEEFATLLGVSRSALAQYEAGHISPGPDALEQYIQLTGQPLSFFTSQRARVEGGLRPFWRSLKRMEAHHRRRITRRLEWAFDLTQYVSQFIELVPLRLPIVTHGYASITDDDIETVAEAVRDLWGLGRGPIKNLPRTMEHNGIVLVAEQVRCDDMDAVSVWQMNRAFVLYADEVKSGPRRNFNLAHELGHLVLHAGVEVSAENLDMIERQANRFAGAFLLPREQFGLEVLGNSLGYFLSLKSRWGVAISALAYRCKDLGIFSPNQQSYLMRQLNARGLRKSEPLDDTFPSSQPSMLYAALRLLIEHGVQTREQVEHALGLTLSDIEALAGAPIGYLQAVAPPPLPLKPR